jgi:hypothetical protein
LSFAWHSASTFTIARPRVRSSASPVDAWAMSLSTLKMVVAPVLIGAVLNWLLPRVVGAIAQYTQVLAVRKVRPTLFAAVEAAALDQLIDEQLMLQDARAQGVTVDEAAVDKAADELPKRAGADGEPLHKLLVAWDKRALPSDKARIRAEAAWKAALAKRLGGEADASASAKELAALKARAKIEKP